MKFYQIMKKNNYGRFYTWITKLCFLIVILFEKISKLKNDLLKSLTKEIYRAYNKNKN